jgi:hypothetical protein
MTKEGKEVGLRPEKKKNLFLSLLPLQDTVKDTTDPTFIHDVWKSLSTCFLLLT